MSLEKKDVRAKISIEAHQHLSAIAELKDKDISDYASFLLERAILGEAYVTKVYAERVARWGRSGNPGENPGNKAKPRLREV